MSNRLTNSVKLESGKDEVHAWTIRQCLRREELPHLVSFTRYSFETVFRNKRRTLYSLTGVALAVSMISGSLLAIDSSVLALYREATKSVDVDAVGEDSTGIAPVDISLIQAAVSDFDAVSGVWQVVPIVVVFGWSFSNEFGESYQPPVLSSGLAVALTDEGAIKLLESSYVEGTPPIQGTVAISKNVADELNIGVGDRIVWGRQVVSQQLINGTLVENSTWLNMTLPVSQIWTQEPVVWDQLDPRERSYWPKTEGTVFIDTPSQGLWNPIVMNVADIDMLNSESSSAYPIVEYFVWYERASLVRLGDFRGTIDRLESVEARLRFAGMEHNTTFTQGQLAYNIAELQRETDNRKLLFVGLSMPILVLGTYLSVVGVDLGISSRRRETGILKSRGASNHQVFSTMMIESAVIGAVAGVVGFACGLVLSRLLLDAASSTYVFTGHEAGFADLYLTPSSIAIALLLGVGLMLVSSFFSIRKASRLDVAEALHFYVPKESATSYRPLADILLLGLVVLSALSVMVSSEESFRFGSSFVVGSLTNAITQIGVLILPVVPLLLSLSVIRLMTRGMKKPYVRFSRVMRPWTRGLSHIVEKNLARNPRRASNVCIIVSLALAFGLLISLAAESAMKYERSLIAYEVGADIRADGESLWNGTAYAPVDSSVLEMLNDVDGVKMSTLYHSVWFGCQLGSGYFGQIHGAAIDARAFATLTEPGDRCFVQSDSSSMYDLERNGTAIIDEGLAKDLGAVVGNAISLTYTFNGASDPPTSVAFEVEVVGVFRDLPGLDHSIIIDERTLSMVPPSELLPSTGAFVDVETGRDETVAAREIEILFEEAGLRTEVVVLEERLDALKKDPKYGALRGFLYTEYALTLVMMSVGVGFIVLVTVSERDREMACMMARGSSRSQVRRIIIGETLSLMLLGMIIGTLVGLLAAYLFNFLNEKQATSVVPHTLEPSIVSLLFVLGSILSFILASLLATYNSGRIKLPDILRVRGG